MPFYISLIVLLGLFAVLGTSATFVVNNIKKIAMHLGIPLFVLGIILGILTSFPEFSIAINASINDVKELSIGNLFGGIMVVFGLILGLAMILNRKIKTDGNILVPLPGFILLILPLLLGLDGVLGFYDGITICVGYIAFLMYLYIKNQETHVLHISIVRRKKIIKEFIFTIAGILAIIISSNLIIKITTEMMNSFNLSPFVIGLIVFSLGTNLPELTVILTSWRKKMSDISFSHMLGSAVVNALILGVMAIISPLSMTVDFSYIIILYFFIIMSVMLLYFYKSDKTLSRSEGIVLVLIFLVFSYLQTSFQ